MVKNYFETKKFKVIALVAFGTLLFWASTFAFIDFGAGVSWGKPYSMLTLYLTKSVNTLEDIEIGDYVLYPIEGTKLSAVHKVIEKFDDGVVVEYFVYDDVKGYEIVWFEEIKEKVMWGQIILKSDNWEEVCYFEFSITHGKENSTKICDDMKNWALEQKKHNS